MPDVPSRNIQQQMYTRERRGVFRAAEGFDTVARSPGLESSFIKKVLHPFCQYEAPAELAARSEKEAAVYPSALHLFHTDAGETVLGRSVFQPADFTGLRSAFFTHHYVIPPGFMADDRWAYRTWLQADFASHYDVEQGIDLPELNGLPVDAGMSLITTPARIMSLLQELGVDEKVFKQLIYACISAASGKKKVYIVLDVPVEQLSEKAEQLLGVLFAALPYALRQVLGFISYAKEPYSKKGLHLMFVEKGGLRLSDRSIEKDYLFELAAGRVINVDLKWSEQPFLDFAWETLRDPGRAERFFEFAQLMLSDMEPAQKIDVRSYHDLCILFQIEEGREELYADHQRAVLRAILFYLSPLGAHGIKQRLDDLFHSRFALEFELVKGGSVPNAAVAGYIKDYHHINPRQHNDAIVEYYIRSLNNALSKQRQDVTEALYSLLEGSPSLSRAFYARVLSSPGLPELLFDPYMKARMKQTATPMDQIDLTSLWVRNHPILLEYEPFIKLVESQLADKLQREADPVRTVNSLLDSLDRLEHDAKQGIGRYPGGTAFADRIIYCANLFLLREVEPEQLSQAQLLEIGFLQMPKDVQGWAARFDSRIQSKVRVMLALHQWFSRPEVKAEVLSPLSAKERERAQQIVRKWLQHDVGPARYESITLAFCTDVESGAIDYRALLQYLHKHSPSPENVYQYLQWSTKQPVFVRPRGLVPAYASAIVQYFKSHDREAFKNKAYVKTYFSSPPAVLKPVYMKARAELASPLVRFIRRNRRLVKIGSTLVLIVLAVGIFLVIQGRDEGPDQADPGPVATPPPTTLESEKPLLTAAEVGEGEQAVTELVFHFEPTAACSEFSVDEIQIVSKDGSTMFEAASPAIERLCGDEATGETTAGDAGDDADTSANESDQNTEVPDGEDPADSNTGGETPSGEHDGVTPDEKSYPNKVVLKLDQLLDPTAIDKVVVDQETYELSEESAFSAGRESENQNGDEVNESTDKDEE